MWHRLLTTPLRVGLARGAICGLAVGVAIALAFGLLPGVVAGLGTGAIIAALSGRASRGGLDALAGLSPADREAVARTVAKGLPTVDRRLAPFVVRYAEAMRRQRTGLDNAERASWVLPVLAGVQALGAVLDVLDRDWWGVAVRSSLAVLFLLFPGLLRRQRQRLDAAERSAQALLDPG